MKKLTFFIIFICAVISINAQSRIDGVWKSNSGNLFQIEANNSGFYYKNLSTGKVLTTVYIGYNYGVPTYRANFNDGSFQLFMIKSDNVLTTSLSYAPNTVYVWKKQSNTNTSYPNSENNNYNNSYKSSSSKTCTYCKGNGEIKCTSCNGKGTYKKMVSTPNYTGSNYELVKDPNTGEYKKVYKSPNEMMDFPCPYCSNGMKTCKVCNGTGKQ